MLLDKYITSEDAIPLQPRLKVEPAVTYTPAPNVAVFPEIVPPFIVNVPLPIYTAPPFVAEFPVIVPPVMVNVPPLTYTPPPFPDVVLPIIEPLDIANVPPEDTLTAVPHPVNLTLPLRVNVPPEATVNIVEPLGPMKLTSSLMVVELLIEIPFTT